MLSFCPEFTTVCQNQRLEKGYPQKSLCDVLESKCEKITASQKSISKKVFTNIGRGKVWVYVGTVKKGTSQKLKYPFSTQRKDHLHIF